LHVFCLVVSIVFHLVIQRMRWWSHWRSFCLGGPKPLYNIIKFDGWNIVKFCELAAGLFQKARNHVIFHKESCNLGDVSCASFKLC
jgi:hypothetical protein